MYSSRSCSPVTEGGGTHKIWGSGGLMGTPKLYFDTHPRPPQIKLTIGGPITHHQVGRAPRKVALDLLGCGHLGGGGEGAEMGCWGVMGGNNGVLGGDK